VDFVFLPEPVVDGGGLGEGHGEGRRGARAMLDAVLAAYETCRVGGRGGDGSHQDGRRGAGAAEEAVAGPGPGGGHRRSVGPPLGESLVVLGRERTLERLRAARSRL